MIDIQYFIRKTTFFSSMSIYYGSKNNELSDILSFFLKKHQAIAHQVYIVVYHGSASFF